MFRFALTLITIAIVLTGCGALHNAHKYQLGDDVYAHKQKGEPYEKAWVFVEDDSVSILSYKDSTQRTFDTRRTQYFVKRTFDVDVMTVGFKYRPAAANLPRSLSPDFNGNVFVGYRIDRFKLNYKSTPFGPKARFGHRGVAAGVFGGIGSTAVTPWTTNYQTMDEYNGLTVSRGLALMFAVNTLTVGAAVGWDYITDRDKSIWIYQNKPWYGVAIGLNLN